MNELVEGIDDLTVAVAGLATFPAPCAEDPSLCASLIGLETARRRLDAAALHLVAEIDGRGVTDEQHGLVTSTWLSRHAHLPRPTGTRMVRLARALGRYDRLDTAITKGDIGIDHLAVIVDASNPRIDAAMVELQDLFLSLIPGRTFARWATEVRNIAAMLDTDGSYDPETDTTANRLHLTAPAPDSTRLLTGRLAGSAAETVHQVLNRIADELALQNHRDHTANPDIELLPRPVLLAQALVEACRRATATTPDTTRGPTTDLTIIIPAVTTPTTDHGDPLDTSDPTTALPHWFGPHPAGASHTHAETPDGHRLPDTTTALLCCDPTITAVVVDTLGRPLDLGHTTRFASPAQRRTTAARDGGCVFPGCHAPPPWCDLHHVIPFPDGPTNLDNLATLCRHHHRVTHRPGWTMHTTPDQWFWWRTPNGHTTWSQRHQHQRAGPTPDG